MTQPSHLPPAFLQPFLADFTLPDPDSHKGQNGKLLIIGGSELFHAASKWSLDIASKLVDMVFYSSVPANNELIQQAKGEFWNGIVIPRDQLENYLQESEAILIGPGMIRDAETEQLTHHLLSTYPTKKWVIDAGALQMLDPRDLTPTCILTPHQGEMIGLETKLSRAELLATQATVVLKGRVDEVLQGSERYEISGGNAGMTKGGTGDVLAGLIAGLYTMHGALPSALIGSYVNKKAGDELYASVGPYFNTSDLVSEIPRQLWQLLQTKA